LKTGCPTAVSKITHLHKLFNTLVRRAGSGHDPSPEMWIFDKPIPLTASELYALTLTEDIETVDTKMGEDKILYAHAIWRADWIIYRFEQR